MSKLLLTKEDQMQEGNSRHRIEELTSEAIKKSFLTVADDMRKAAKQAKEQALVLEREAEEFAQQLLERGSNYADLINVLLERCRSASESFRKHRELLVEMQESEAVKPQSPLPQIGQETAKAIVDTEHLLDRIKQDSRHEHAGQDSKTKEAARR